MTRPCDTGEWLRLMRPVGSTDGTPATPAASWASFNSPVGGLTVAATPAGLLRLEFAPRPPIAATDADGAAHPGDVDADGGGEVAARWLELVGAELAGYFAGDLQRFTVPLDWSLVRGGRRQVLQTLYETVDYGRTTTYGQLATASGRPGAARLVGTVMGSNPIAIVVPCHRVLAGDGSLGGYGPGVPFKRLLLELEGALPAPLLSW
jgi:methylated-DNA-[protein]-cysteine S-methyltransferase